MKRWIQLLAIEILILFSAGAAWSSDGVLEINQTCATTTGCFAGDTAGFPVTINGTAGRSYRLTSDLVVSSTSTNGIAVYTNAISIDLNGFSVEGPTTCTGVPVTSCSPTGSGDGITTPVSSGVIQGLEVRNGSVRGFGRFGIQSVAHATRIENVRADNNGLSGIVVNSTTSVRGGSVRNCTSIGNGIDGIYIGSDGLAQGNVANGNGRWGISAIDRSIVLDNTLTSNANVGLTAGAATGYARNVISDNNGGNLNAQVAGSGTEIGQNLCGTNTTCP